MDNISNRLKLNKTDFISNFAFPVLLENRDRAVINLSNNGIEIRPIISGSMGRQPIWIKKYGLKRLKNADDIHYNGFYVPNNHTISKEDILLICDIIKGSI